MPIPKPETRTQQPIRGSSSGFPLAGWLIAGVWNVILAVQLADFRPVLGRVPLAWTVAGMFVLIGAGILWYAIVSTLRWQRYRGIALDLNPYPGEAGGVVAGSLLVPVPYDDANRFKFRLTCTEHGMRGGVLRKNNSYERTLFKQAVEARASPAPNGTLLAFRIAVPADAPASDSYPGGLSWTRATADRIYTRWTLQLTADVKGVDLQETFRIPVRRVDGADVPRASQGMLDAPVAVSAAPSGSGRASGQTLPGGNVGAAPPARPAPIAAAGILLVVLLAVGFQAWPVLRAHLGIGGVDPAARKHPADTARPQLSPGMKRPDPAPARADDWQAQFRLGAQAKLEQRPQDALRSYDEALAIIQRTRGAEHPLAAVIHERIADIHTDHRRHIEAEAALRRALAILEKHPHDAVRAQGGRLVAGFDRESVLRQLGWALWEQRRYADALQAYQRAYDTVAELDIDERDRNRRLAYSAAGIMAAACTQREWARADRAMTELKERIGRVSAADRKWLDYWVRTGEPRLSARKC